MKLQILSIRREAASSFSTLPTAGAASFC